MFIHNLKYTIKVLFKNKILIFWTFAFPIILGIFFNMAFSNIDIDEGNYLINTEEIVNDILNKIENQKIDLKNIANSNLSYMQIEYYTLIAMACMYGGMIGLTTINNCIANMSSKGKRVSISPNKKSIIVLSSVIGAYIVSFIGILILIAFLKLILKVDFGDNMVYVLSLSAIGDLAGIALGVLISSTLKVSEGAKISITIAITMFLSVLSGMMGVTLKYMIDKNIPIINLVNPNNLITDGFYSLYYYNTLSRYLRDVKYLLVFIVICLVISLISLRREKYDSI